MKTEIKEIVENLSPNKSERVNTREFAKNNTSILTEFLNSSLSEAHKRTIESKTRNDISELKKEIK